MEGETYLDRLTVVNKITGKKKVYRTPFEAEKARERLEWFYIWHPIRQLQARNT